MENPSHFQIRLLITPSWLSGLVSVVTGLAVIGVAALLARFSGSIVEQEVFALHSATAGAAANSRAIATSLSRNRLLDNLPLFAFWAGVGLIVYLFATHIVKAFSRAIELEQEMNYVHTKRQALIRQAMLQALIRLTALLLLIALLLLTFHKVLPSSLQGAHALAASFSLPHLAAALVWAVVLAIDTSLLTIGLRLLFLRPRLFGTPIST
jgi:hypothetical protein